MKRVLLTGATGFIGCHMLRALINEGYQVVATKRHNSTILPEFIDLPEVSWLLIEDSMFEMLSKSLPIEAIIHLSTSYSRDSSDIVDVELSNVVFPLRLLDFAAKNGISIFINTDSFYTKPEFSYQHMLEYVCSKKNFSAWGRCVAKTNKDFKFVNARLEHVYGTGDGKKKFVPDLLTKLQHREKELFLTSCEQRRDFIFVSDVVSAYIALLGNVDKVEGYKEIGIGSGKSLPLRNFVMVALELTGANTKIMFDSIPMRKNEIMDSYADVDFLKSINWSPQVSIDAGIQKIIDDYLCIL